MRYRTPLRCALVLSIAFGLAAATPGDALADRFKTKKVVVRPGDTLLRIAQRNNVSVDDLRRWNRRKIRQDDVIRLGDTLVIRIRIEEPKTPGAKPEKKKTDKADPKKVWKLHYQIQPGDTLGGIARKLKVPLGELIEWNKLSGPSAVIRAGATLVYEKPGARPSAQSVGLPTSGRLINGVHVGRGKGYRLRFPNAAYTTPFVRKTLRRCARHVAARFPGTADILIGDASKPAGGFFPPHATHQSGRDVDLGYYLAGNKQNKTLHRCGAYQLDYAKNWALLRCMLLTGRVVRIYMDRKIQKGYVDFLKEKRGASDALLARMFGVAAETPRSALVRHSDGHDTHLHIRFSCRNGDKRCEEETADEPFTL